VQGVAGGSQGVLDLLTGNDALRGILESAGFVLDDVLQDAGLVLEVSLKRVVFSMRDAAQYKCKC